MAVKPARPSLRFDVKGLRKRLGLDQDELAALIHSTERSIRRWEREGINPHRTAIALMKRLEAERFSNPTAVPVIKTDGRKRNNRIKVDPAVVPFGILPSSM